MHRIGIGAHRSHRLPDLELASAALRCMQPGREVQYAMRQFWQAPTTYYMADMKALMKKRYGNDSWGLALRAYNSGENGVDPNNLHALPAGTGDPAYVDKVMNYWAIIDNGGQLPA